MTLSGSNLNEGDITFYDGTFGNGSPIGIFTQVQSVWFSQKDSAGVPHGFDNVEPGYLLELFVQGEDDFGLFEVVEVHDETSNIQNPYYAIDVNFIRALDATSKADAGDRVRMKTFQAPTGGTADGFVLKTGDTIPCDNSPISFPNTYTDNSLKPGVSSVQAYVKFTSKNTNDNSTQTINIFQPGHINALMTNGKFFSKQDLYSQGLKGFKNDLYTKSSIDVSTDIGYLNHGDSGVTERLRWDAGGVSIRRPHSSSGSGEGFNIKASMGDHYSDTTRTSYASSILRVIHNQNATDSVDYRGRIIERENITNKGYVDDKFDFSKYQELS
jgi:hypothetical protein